MVVPLPHRRVRPDAAASPDRGGDRQAQGEEPASAREAAEPRDRRTAFLKLVDRQRVNVTTADLPGPDVPLYLAGARLLEVFPVLPLLGKVSLGVGALSYAGQLDVTAVADGDACPDLEVFAAGVRDELGALGARPSRSVSSRRPASRPSPAC